MVAALKDWRSSACFARAGLSRRAAALQPAFAAIERLRTAKGDIPALAATALDPQAVGTLAQKNESPATSMSGGTRRKILPPRRRFSSRPLGPARLCAFTTTEPTPSSDSALEAIENETSGAAARGPPRLEPKRAAKSPQGVRVPRRPS